MVSYSIYSKFHNSIKNLDKQQYHLVFVHVHVTLHIVVPAYIVPFCIAQVCLSYVKQQVEYLLLLVKEIHISGMPSSVGGALCAANGSERHQQNYFQQHPCNGWGGGKKISFHRRHPSFRRFVSIMGLTASFYTYSE